jgi:putative acetyltransferase
MEIKLSKSTDLNDICSVHSNAFGEEENETIVELVTEFLTIKSNYSTFSFINTCGSEIIGNIIFSEVKFNHNFKGFILAPLAVLPDHQKKGIGANLINYGLKHLTSYGTNFVLVYGDPNYYSKCGFSVSTSNLFIPPYKLQFPQGWQYIALNNSILPSSPIKLTCAPPLQKPELW